MNFSISIVNHPTLLGLTAELVELRKILSSLLEQPFMRSGREVSVFESSRVLQPVANGTVDANVSSPDECDPDEGRHAEPHPAAPSVSEFEN